MLGEIPFPKAALLANLHIFVSLGCHNLNIPLPLLTPHFFQVGRKENPVIR